VGNVSTNVCAKFCCAPLHIKKALGIFGPLENWQQQQQPEKLFGSRLPGPKNNITPTMLHALCWFVWRHIT